MSQVFPWIEADDPAFAGEMNAIIMGILGDGVLLGLAVTAGAGSPPNVDVATGDAQVSGVGVDSAGGNVVLSNGDATYDRYDIITIDNAGTLGKVEGTPEAFPEIPDLPANKIILATVIVPQGATSITDTNVYYRGRMERDDAWIMPNNKKLQWKHATSGVKDLLYMNSSNQIIVGHSLGGLDMFIFADDLRLNAQEQVRIKNTVPLEGERAEGNVWDNLIKINASNEVDISESGRTVNILGTYTKFAGLQVLGGQVGDFQESDGYSRRRIRAVPLGWGEVESGTASWDKVHKTWNINLGASSSVKLQFPLYIVRSRTGGSSQYPYLKQVALACYVTSYTGTPSADFYLYSRSNVQLNRVQEDTYNFPDITIYIEDTFELGLSRTYTDPGTDMHTPDNWWFAWSFSTGAGEALNLDFTELETLTREAT